MGSLCESKVQQQHSSSGRPAAQCEGDLAWWHSGSHALSYFSPKYAVVSLLILSPYFVSKAGSAPVRQ